MKDKTREDLIAVHVTAAIVHDMRPGALTRRMRDQGARESEIRIAASQVIAAQRWSASWARNTTDRRSS